MTSRRTLFKQFAAAGLLTGIPALIREALAAGNKPIAPGIHTLKGVVTVNGHPAKAGMLVAPGDHVVTGPQGEVVFVVGQDAFLQRENTSVQLLGKAALDGIRIVSGKLLSVFGRGQKTLTTPTAVLGIRGTGCYIEAEARQTYLCLCYGEADLTPLAAPGNVEKLVTTHHESPRWISGDDLAQPIRKAPMINHTDDELILLESLVGRLPPFHGKNGEFSKY